MSIKDKFKNIFNKNKKIEVVEINENSEKETDVKTEKEIFTEKIHLSQRLQKMSEKSFVLIRYAFCSYPNFPPFCLKQFNNILNHNDNH